MNKGKTDNQWSHIVGWCRENRVYIEVAKSMADIKSEYDKCRERSFLLPACGIDYLMTAIDSLGIEKPPPGGRRSA